jgi:glycosyltransferase involved in cell wall biosynthesis
MKNNISIIIPAKNECEGLRSILPALCELYPEYEIIVVDDGSTDDTATVCQSFPVKIVTHNYSKGNGASIKSGARAAAGDIFVFMDADGQHCPDEIPKLLDEIAKGYDMVVGARNMNSHASLARSVANFFYNCFATWVSGHKVLDLTSGFRAVRSDKFRQFLYLLPNGFSYPTTITMALFRAGYSIAYVRVKVIDRIGKSHIRPIVDGLRFLLIIFRIGTLYSPLKFFAPASLLFFITGVGYYTYTYYTLGRFTNMGTMLFIISILVFLIGLISEQLTMLLYSNSQDGRNKQ